MRIRPTALVIEDDAYAQRLIGAVADRAGYTVTSAVTGAEAETAADTLPFDIIVVDLNLPDVDGLSLIERLRARPQLEEVPFMVCSGNVSVDTVTGAGRLGVLEFIKKPIDLPELQRRLERSYDLLPLRWNAPSNHRTTEHRQSANEALVRARAQLVRVIELLETSISAVAVGDSSLRLDGTGAGTPETTNGKNTASDLDDLLPTLQIDAATISAPRLERLVSDLAGTTDLERRALLAVALKVGLKSLDTRLEH